MVFSAINITGLAAQTNPLVEKAVPGEVRDKMLTDFAATEPSSPDFAINSISFMPEEVKLNTGGVVFDEKDSVELQGASKII